MRDYLHGQGFVGIGGGRFFINGVDTETQGVDIVANYSVAPTSIGQFDFTLGANFIDTDVTRVPATPLLSALNPAPVLFDRVNVLTFEEGTPSDKYTLVVDWTMGQFGANVPRDPLRRDVDPAGRQPGAGLHDGPRHVLLDLEAPLDVNDRSR